MRRILMPILVTVLWSAIARTAAAQDFAECDFGFAVNAESSALQALVEKAAGKGGFWLSISEAPPDVRRIARHIGRLQVCLSTPDGKPRTINRAGQTMTLDSPFVTNCTATLLPGNRLLTNNHCYYDPDLVRAGFTIVQEARVNFDYTSRDLTDDVLTYRVAPRELAAATEVDALVLQVIGDPNRDLGGHFPLRMTEDIAPLQDLIMIHHPGAQPQQYSTGTCKVHRRQAEVADRASALRHTCETTGGSSGALLLDARTLAVVALHNQGGLRSTGDGFNGGHKIAAVNGKLGLGFDLVADGIGPGPEFEANRALADALMVAEGAARIAALQTVEARFAGSEAAAKARSAAEREQAAVELARAAEAEAARRRDAAEADAATQRLALQALADAMLVQDTAAQQAALEAVIAEFAGTPAAERARKALEQVRAAEAEAARRRDAAEAGAATLRLALQALADAMLLPDPETRKAALEAVIADFAGTPAAERARTALEQLDITLQRTARNSEAQQRQAAFAVLTEALLIGDIDARRIALAAVSRDFPGSEAAEKAALALKRLETSETPAALDREAQVARARLRCALAAASPFDPARPATLPGIALERIDTEKAIAACSHPDAELASDPATSFALARAYEAKGDYAEALGYYRLAHAAGHAAATTALGRFARDGQNGAADLEQAIGYFDAAAEAGDPVAMTFLAAIYESEGGSILRDYATAVRYLERAAELNHPHALFAKAEAYRNGTLYLDDPKKALEYYRRAAEAGDMRALYEEAMMYWRGAKGLDVDKTRALELLMAAAESGDRMAQHRIGNAYLYGVTDPASDTRIAPDFVKAKRWLGLAAENGFVQAQMQLGKIFAQGSHGVTKDAAEALHWYELAAQQDFVQGLVTVARMYEAGEGTEKDPEKAAAYWMRAMLLRSNAARQRSDTWDRETARELQRLLREAGVYDGPLDGAVGPGTDRAMKDYVGRSSRNITFFEEGIRIERTNRGWLCQC